MNTLEMIAGIDVGNGYVKGRVGVITDTITTYLVDMPSTVSYTRGSDIPIKATDDYMSDFVNNLDATITSPAIPTIDRGRVFYGQRAIRTGDSVREFNIDDHTPKCKDSLSTMLILGSLASTAIKAYWDMHGGDSLPYDGVTIDASIGIALPIEDFMEWKDVYRDTLMRDRHLIVVHNFDRDITVTVTFKNVQVLAEGAAAQYAINAIGAEFIQFCLDDARYRGSHIDDEYTGEVLARAGNTIGIDIGEGTVNFPVFRNGLVSIESSTSINVGYGTVLSHVVAATRNKPYAFESRKALADFMIKDPTTLMPAQRSIQEQVQHYIDEQCAIFVRDIMKEFTHVFRKVGLDTTVIYVYGGGASAVRSLLEPALVSAATFSEDSSVPVIYLHDVYSRDLNRTGLYQRGLEGARAVGMRVTPDNAE